MARSRPVEDVEQPESGEAPVQEPERVQEVERGSVDRDSVDPDVVARRAYQRFEERGRQHGADQDDWFTAERELREEQERARGR
jgi:hypothetical protein